MSNEAQTNNKIPMTKKQESTRGAAFLASVLMGADISNAEAKIMATQLFKDWPEDLKEKTSPACGAVEIADREAEEASVKG